MRIARYLGILLVLLLAIVYATENNAGKRTLKAITNRQIYFPPGGVLLDPISAAPTTAPAPPADTPAPPAATSAPAPAPPADTPAPAPPATSAPAPAPTNAPPISAPAPTDAPAPVTSAPVPASPATPEPTTASGSPPAPVPASPATPATTSAPGSPATPETTSAPGNPTSNSGSGSTPTSKAPKAPSSTKNSTSNAGDNNASAVASEDNQTLLLKIWLPIVIVAILAGIVLFIIVSALLFYKVRKSNIKKKEKMKMLQTLANQKHLSVVPSQQPNDIETGGMAPGAQPTTTIPGEILPPPYSIEPEQPSSQVDVICPLTGELYREPVTLVETGNTYERGALEKWLQNNDTDPMTGARLYTKSIQEDMQMRTYVKEWLSGY
jgi:hypothetical protein